MSFSESCITTDQSSHGPFLGPVDIMETKTAFIFKVDAPGLTKADVKVRISDGTIHIAGERHQEKDDSVKYHRTERAYGKFCRAFHLPDGVDVTKVSANCDHGVLNVNLPKSSDTPRTAVTKVNDTLLATDEEGDGSLNETFDSVPISVFPQPALGKLVTIRSDESILSAVKTLSRHHILAAPVRDVTQPDTAPWNIKYSAMLDTVGIVFFMLEKLEPEGKDHTDFEKEIETVESFKNTTVGELAKKISGLSKFVAVESGKSTLLDAILLCGKHAQRRVSVVQGTDLVNIITQSALIQTVSANLKRFASVATRTMTELGLGTPLEVFSVTTENALKDAFRIIKEKDVNGVPVIDPANGRIVGNISARDVRLIVSSNKIYKLLNMPVRVYLEVVADGSANSAITCTPDDTMEEVIQRLVRSRIHRIYLVNADQKPIRVISLRNVLMKFVKEPSGHFGQLFDS